MKRPWAVGLEDASEQLDLSELENPVEGVEAKLVEANAADSEIEELAGDGESLGRDTENLENLEDTVSDAAGDDGEGEVSETAARAVDVAVEHFAQRWGISRRNYRVGNESAKPSDSVKAKVALESIMDAVKDAWHTFVQWLTELLAKLKDWWLKYVNAGKSIRERADKLSDRLDNLGAKEKDKIKGNWMKDLCIDQRVDVENVISIATGMSSTMERYLKNVMVRITAAGELVRQKGRGSRGFVKAESEEANFGKKTTKAMSKLVPSGSKSVAVRAIPGNGYIISYLMNDVSETRFFAAPTEGNSTDLPKEMPTPDLAAMKKACSAASTAGDILEKRLKDFRAVNDDMSKLKDAAKTAADAFKDAKAEEKADKKLAMREARAAVNSALVMNRSVVYALKAIGTGLLGYVTAGIGAYKKTAA